VTQAPDPRRENYIRLIEGQSTINGRYGRPSRLGERAGDGVFSLVFRATHLATGRDVCLKIYNPERRDSYREECFERESQTMSILDGEPDIVRLVEPATDFNCPVTLHNGSQLQFPFRYLAMELAAADIRQYIYLPRKRTLREDLEYFRVMCRAVQRIRERKICHRDIKPDNFLLFRDGALRLGDFGTARLVGVGTPPLRQEYEAGWWPGDLRYTAPELLCGLEDPSLFFSADIFALGATLFELLTQSYLTQYIYDPRFLTDLREAFGAMDPHQRPGMFAGLIPTIAASRPLPDIQDLTDRIPGCVLRRLDGLYKNMAALDFRRRPLRFDEIFQQIAMCETILRNEEKFRALHQQQQQWREKAREKQARREARIGRRRCSVI